MILDLYLPGALELMFKGNKDKIKEYGDYLVEHEDYFFNTFEEMPKSVYDQQIEDIKNQKSKTLDDIILNCNKLNHVKRKIKKNNKYNKHGYKKDLSIASYVNDKKYKKKILDNNKYRKELKRIAKAEKEELKEMKRLGYISNKDKLDKALKKEKACKANEKFASVLNDAYSQKYFIN